MKLIIAEKPDQGAKLAAPFPHGKKTGYIEIKPCKLFPEGALLTWAVGHLCELVPPEQYDSKWKKWSLDTLPIMPERFQHQVVKSKWKQFNVIKGLMKRTDIKEVIIASDAGREGEAIVRIILSLCMNNRPTKRLWISSLTPNAVIQGFNQLLDEKDTRNIYYEAISRSCADWLVGINASRAYTLLLQQQGFSDVFSTGRVQTPTLALIVKREDEINSFQSEPFWEVVADFNKEGSNFLGKWHKEGETRIQDKLMAEKIMVFCEGKKGEITSVEKERKSFQPPFLFNLSSLQSTANKLYKFSPQQTLDIAQKLYLKGIISYPRSDSNFLTKEEGKMLPEILKQISQIEQYKSYFPLPVNSILNNKRFVNEKKVKDHYAIIPTEQVKDPRKLSNEEEKIYDLIIKRVIAAHCESAIFDYTTVHSLVDNRATFISKGKETIQEGWRKVIYANENEKKKDSNEEQDLPTLNEGDSLDVVKVEVKEGKTQAPKRYTEGELITLMKTAGKHIEDNELGKVLNRTEGLGTEATRAGIIGVLKERKYIFVQKNRVFATEKGKLLIRTIGKSILASPEMTAKWEQRLSEIGDGEASPAVFMEQVKKLSDKLITDAITESKSWVFDGIDVDSVKLSAPKRRGKGQKSRTAYIGKCKKCNGMVVDKGNFYGCSNYRTNKCDFTISKKLLGKAIPVRSIKKLLEEGKTEVISGFQKNDRSFDALLTWNEKLGKIEFKWE